MSEKEGYLLMLIKDIIEASKSIGDESLEEWIEERLKERLKETID